MARTKTRRFVPKPDQYAWTFGGVDPVMRVEPGSMLSVWTEDAFCGKITSHKDLPSKVLVSPFVNPQTGPFYVDGAEPGDTLAIHLYDVEPARDWAASTTVPLFGSLTSSRFTPMLHGALPEKVWIYQVDKARQRVKFQAIDSDYSTWIPLHPMHGTVGVAPSLGEARHVLVPEAFGGNMDTPEMCKGTTIYLGVNVKGALFSLGDGHYAQGEGEVCGVAVEGAMETTLGIELIKGRYTDWPVLENDEYMMTVGANKPLEDAFRIAQTEMVKLLSQNCGLSALDAYQLITQVNKTPVANVVDTNYAVVTKVHKQFLPKSLKYMGGVHKAFRARTPKTQAV